MVFASICEHASSVFLFASMSSGTAGWMISYEEGEAIFQTVLARDRCAKRRSGHKNSLVLVRNRFKNNIQTAVTNMRKTMHVVKQNFD